MSLRALPRERVRRTCEDALPAADAALSAKAALRLQIHGLNSNLEFFGAIVPRGDGDSRCSAGALSPMDAGGRACPRPVFDESRWNGLSNFTFADRASGDRPERGLDGVRRRYGVGQAWRQGLDARGWGT